MKYKGNTLVNELEELNEGVEYILEFYKDKQLLTKQEIETTTSNGEAEIIARNKILHAIIKVIQIQRQGKNIQNIGEFMLGSSIKKDTKLNNA